MTVTYECIRPALLLAAAVVLAGCAGAQSDFECGATAGDTCMTMEAANDRARALAAPVKPAAGALPRLADRQAAMPAALPTAGGQVSTVSLKAEQAADAVPAVSVTVTPAADAVPVRSPEITAGVWIAPWTDDAGVLHEPGRLSFVAVPSRWRLAAGGE